MTITLYCEERYPTYDVQAGHGKPPLITVEVTADWYQNAREIIDAYDALMKECDDLNNRAVGLTP